jgi:hypothetical protein
MIDERSVWKAASFLVAKYGPVAPAIAEQHAEHNARHRLESQRVEWMQVAQASAMLLRSQRSRIEQVH